MARKNFTEAEHDEVHVDYDYALDGCIYCEDTRSHEHFLGQHDGEDEARPEVCTDCAE